MCSASLQVPATPRVGGLPSDVATLPSGDGAAKNSRQGTATPIATPQLLSFGEGVRARTGLGLLADAATTRTPRTRH